METAVAIEKPFVWQMIKEAVEKLNGRAAYSDIRSYINGKWENVNSSTITAQTIVLTVNHPSRIHYPENQKPRLSNSKYDLFFTTGRGQVVSYNPDEHGVWEIYKNDFGGLGVRQVISDDVMKEDEEVVVDEVSTFPLEASLRDFLITNLHSFKGSKLKLFEDETGRDGKEYPTGVGPIDILAVDDKGDFYVFELKLSKGPDRALGQLLRYMGWLKKNLAKGKNVSGVVVASKMDEKIKFAVTMVPNVKLYEYQVSFQLTPLELE